MSLALILVGILFLTAGVRDKQDDLFSYLHDDFTGENNFLQWALALILLGAIGFVPKLKSFSTALIALVLVAIFLRKGTGFFEQLTTAVGVQTQQ